MAIRRPLPPLPDVEEAPTRTVTRAVTTPMTAPIDRQPVRRVARRRSRSTGPPGLALAVALPNALTALGGALPVVIEPLRRPGVLPYVIVALIVTHVGGLVLTRALGLDVWRRIWTVNMLVGAGLVPALTVQSSLTRMPYVSVERGSAGPVILATGAVVVALLVIAGVTAVSTWTAPEDASLVFLPAALVVPIALGLPSDQPELRAFQALALTFALAALVTWLAHLFPRGSRSLFGPFGMALQLGVFAAIGLGPAYHTTSVGVASVTSRLFLCCAIVLLTIVPLLALWMRHAVQHGQHLTLPESSRPGPGQ